MACKHTVVMKFVSVGYCDCQSEVDLKHLKLNRL